MKILNDIKCRSHFQLAVARSGRAASGFAIASVIPSSLRSSGQYRQLASLAAALRIPHATHPHPLSLKKRGAMRITLFAIVPPL